MLVAVITFRMNSFSEGKVAFWTTLLFALAPASNLLSAGPKAIHQVVITVIAGFLFYLIRRYRAG